MAEDPGKPSPQKSEQNKKAVFWSDLHLWQIQPIRDVLLGIAVLLVLWLGYEMSLVTVPVLLAALLAYLFEPAVAWATRVRALSRQGVVAGIIAALVLIVVVPAVVGGAIAVSSGYSTVMRITQNVIRLEVATRPSLPEEPLAEEQLDRRRDARTALPETWLGTADYLYEVRYLDAAGELGEPDPTVGAEPVYGPPLPEEMEPEGDTDLNGNGLPEEVSEEGKVVEADPGPWFVPEPRPLTEIEELLNTQFLNAKSYLEDDEKLAQLGQVALTGGLDLAAAVVGRVVSTGVLAFQLFLTLFFFYFFSTSWGKVLDFWGDVLPHHKRGETVDLIRKMDRVVAGFVRGRLTIAFLQSLIFCVLYWAIGVPTPILLGFATGVLSIVPYLAIVTQPVAILLMFLDPAEGMRGAWWWAILAPIVVYQIGQAADDYVLTPWIQGKATGLDTPTVLFASIGGAAIAGVYGLLVAIPVAACVKIILRDVVWPKVQRWVRGEAADPLPIGHDDDDES